MGRRKGGTPWIKGKTKEQYPQLSKSGCYTPEVRKLLSESVKETYRNGRKPWNKGLTKETDPRVAVKPQTQETKDKHRQVMNEYWCKPEVHQQRSLGVQGEKNPFHGKHHDQEAKDAIGTAGIKRWKDPQRRKNQSDAMKVVWTDPVWAEEMSAKVLAGNQSTRPNGPEKKVIEILKSMVSDIKYVGDGTFWVNHKNPDFVNEDKKQIIEVLGCFWHGCKKCYPDAVKLAAVKAKVKLFKDSGYSILCIWEHELENLDKVTSRIQKFSEAKYD